MTRAERPEPTFTVVLPTYNRAHVVNRAIQSVLGQTFPHFELIVVDDGSTDASWELLCDITDRRVRLVRNVRAKGAPGARNTGIDLAAGEWICAIDSDDEWDADFLRLLEEGIARSGEGVGIVYGSVTFVEDGRPTRIVKAETSGMTYPRMLHEHFFYHTASAFRTSSLRALGGYDERLADGEDTDMQLRLTEHCEMLPIPEAMYFYYRANSADRMTQDHLRSTMSKQLFLKKHAALFAAYPLTRFSYTNQALTSAVRGRLWGVATSMWLRLLPLAWHRPRTFVRYQLNAVSTLASQILQMR